MIYELLEALVEQYESNDIEILAEILHWLYHNTTNYQLQNAITDYMDEYGYCVECGEKLVLYEGSETHTELDGNPIEHYSLLMCPKCDSEEIKNNHYERKETY